MCPRSKLRGILQVKGSVGALAIFNAFWAAVYIEKLFFSERNGMLSLLLGTIIAITIYICISSILFKSEKMKIIGIEEFTGTGILTLFAWLVWLSLNEMLEKYYDEAGLLSFLVPILIAWLFYKVTSKALLKKKVEPDGI